MNGGVVIIPNMAVFRHVCDALRESPHVTYRSQALHPPSVARDGDVTLTIKRLPSGWRGAVCPYCGTEYRVK